MSFKVNEVDGVNSNTDTLDKMNHQINSDDERLIGKKSQLFNDENLNDPLEVNDRVKDKAQLCGMTRGLAILVIISIVFAFAVTVALIIHIYVGPPEKARFGAVATESTYCSKISLDVLKDGGNAVDAAVAALFCLGVTENQHCGIGGGFFMIIHDHMKNKSIAIDARESAPSKSTTNMFLKVSETSKYGKLSVAVPGLVRGLEYAHTNYGKLEWRRLIQPSAELARRGFNLSESAGRDIKTFSSKYNLNGTLLGEIYSPNNVFIKAGTIVRRPALAHTYDIIAELGADAFYSGTLAEGIVNELQPEGILTLDDLKNYKVVKREPLLSTFYTPSTNFTLVTMPLPGGGPVVVNILNIISSFNWSRDDINSTQRYYQMLEAFRYAYAARTGLGDPAFDIGNTIKQWNMNMTSVEEARKIAAKILQLNRTMTEDSYPHAGVPMDDKGTSHVTIVDSEEVYVSATTSLNYVFGSKIMTKSGIVLNNHMNDFANTDDRTFPSVNSPAPGKRPLSSMSPTVLMDSKHPCGPRLALGGINAIYIPTGVVEVIVNHFLFGLGLEAAINRPRITNTWTKETLYEKGLPDEIVKSLPQFGYSVKMKDPIHRLSFIMAVSAVNDSTVAYTDPGVSGKAMIFNA